MKEEFITYDDFSEMVSSCYYWGGEKDFEGTRTEHNKLNTAVQDHAIGFAVWCSGNMGASIELFSPEEQQNFYQQYLETLTSHNPTLIYMEKKEIVKVELNEDTLPVVDNCTWCDKPIVKPVGSDFLTGLFGYGYCSTTCMESHINSK